MPISGMVDYGFLFSLLLIATANFFQMTRIVINRGSKGVSLGAFVNSSIFHVITILVAVAQPIVMLSYVGLFFSALTILLILYFSTEGGEPIKDFIYGLVGSVFLVAGVSQAIKSYRHDGLTEDVSPYSWVVWVVYLANNIFLAQSPYIVAANIVTITLCIFILYRCFSRY